MQGSLFDEVVSALPPFRAGNATQESAAKSIAPHTPTLRERVYDFIRANQGATNEEIAYWTGIKLSSVCGRVSELRKLDRIRDSGMTRAGASGVKAKIWRAV